MVLLSDVSNVKCPGEGTISIFGPRALWPLLRGVIIAGTMYREYRVGKFV